MAAPPRIRTEVQVMFFDTDCGRVVCHIGYLCFIEIAHTHLVEELGLALAEIAEIDYRRAAKLGDRLVIEGWLDQLQRARFWCGFPITRPKDNILIAQYRQMLALIEMSSMKLLRLPETWQEYWKADSVRYAKGETSNRDYIPRKLH